MAFAYQHTFCLDRNRATKHYFYTSYKIKVLATCHISDSVLATLTSKRTEAPLSRNFAGATTRTRLQGQCEASASHQACSTVILEPALNQVPKKVQEVHFREASEFLEKVDAFAATYGLNKSQVFRVAFRLGLRVLSDAEKYLTPRYVGGLVK